MYLKVLSILKGKESQMKLTNFQLRNYKFVFKNNQFFEINLYIGLFVYVLVIFVNLNTGINYHGTISYDRI